MRVLPYRSDDAAAQYKLPLLDTLSVLQAPTRGLLAQHVCARVLSLTHHPTMSRSQTVYLGLVACLGVGYAVFEWTQTRARAVEVEGLQKRIHELENRARNTADEVLLTRRVAGLAGRDAASAAEAVRELEDGPPQRSTDEGEDAAFVDEETVAVDDDYDYEAQERFFEDYFGVLERTRESEVSDDTWEAVVRASAEEAFREQLLGNRLAELDCGASLCRMRVTHENEESRALFSSGLLIALAVEVGQATFHGPFGARESTGYLGRRGYRLPPPTRRPGE